MSRSHKKTKVVKIGKNSFLKKHARKLLRKNNEVTNFSNYKKHFESWDICDGRFYITKEDENTIWNRPENFRK